MTAEFFDDVLHMRADRRLTDTEPHGYFGVAQPIGQMIEDAAFSRCKFNAGSVEYQAHCHRRWNMSPPGGNGTDRRLNLIKPCIFQDIAARASFQRAVNRFIAIESGENKDPSCGMPAHNGGGCRSTVFGTEAQVH